MKCKHCGEEIANDSVFCEFCGQKVLEQYEEDIINILNVVSKEDQPLVAYKARYKCYKLCEKKHPSDYKEYVNKLMMIKYPSLYEKSKIDTRYLKRHIILWIICLGCIGVAYSVHWETFDVFFCLYNNAPYYFHCVSSCSDIPGVYYEYSIIFALCSILAICTLVLIATIGKWYRKQLQKNDLIFEK